jgi:hypothetical protein
MSISRLKEERLKIHTKAILIIGLLLGGLLSLSCSIQSLFTPTSTPTSTPTKTSTPTLTPTNTPTLTLTPTSTATPTPTATATPTATPTPAVFNKRPEYLETAFGSAGWVWADVSGGRVATRKNSATTMILVGYDSNSIFIGGIWNLDTGDFDFINGFFPVALQDFVDPATALKIIAFKNEHVNSEVGKYEGTVDGFDLSFNISEDSEANTRTIILSITEDSVYD